MVVSRLCQAVEILRNLFTPCSRVAETMSLINQASKEPTEMRLSRALQSAARYSSPFVRFVLATPLHRIMSSQLMLLRFTGRKTGRSYTTPVGYVLDGNSLLVPAGGAWRGTSRLNHGPACACAACGGV